MSNEQQLITQLKKYLRDAKKIAVVGVGQQWCSDDAVGIVTLERLYKKLSGSDELPLNLFEEDFRTMDGKTIRLFLGMETPESLTGKLRDFMPSYVLFIDAAELNDFPGKIDLISMRDIIGEEISTHNLPLSILGKFLEMDMGCSSIMLGIQPCSTEFTVNKSLSEKVDQAASNAVELIYQVLFVP